MATAKRDPTHSRGMPFLKIVAHEDTMGDSKSEELTDLPEKKDNERLRVKYAAEIAVRYSYSPPIAAVDIFAGRQVLQGAFGLFIQHPGKLDRWDETPSRLLDGVY